MLLLLAVPYFGINGLCDGLNEMLNCCFHRGTGGWHHHRIGITTVVISALRIVCHAMVCIACGWWTNIRVLHVLEPNLHVVLFLP